MIVQQLKNQMKAKVSFFSTNFDWINSYSFLDNSLNETLPLRSINTTRRFRSSFTSEQTEILEQFFCHTPYPDVTTRENLSQHLNIEENRIQVWFSNRRVRSKKSTVSSISSIENEIPSFLASPIMDVKPYPINDNVFDPTVTSSPSISMSKLY